MQMRRKMTFKMEESFELVGEETREIVLDWWSSHGADLWAWWGEKSLCSTEFCVEDSVCD